MLCYSQSYFDLLNQEKFDSRAVSCVLPAPQRDSIMVATIILFTAQLFSTVLQINILEWFEDHWLE